MAMPMVSVALVVAAMLSTLTTAQGRQGNNPRVTIGPQCAPLCVNLTRSTKYNPGCAQCLLGSGWLPVLANTSTPGAFGEMRRLPLHEMGHPSVMAIPSTLFPPYFYGELGYTQYMARLDMANGPKNVTICYGPNNATCETRNLFATGVIPNSSSPTGFCSMGPIPWCPLDPQCNGQQDPLAASGGVAFNSLEQLAEVLTPTREENEFQDWVTAKGVAGFRNINASADAPWKTQVSVGPNFHYRQLTEADTPFLLATFGDDWKTEWNAKLAAKKLVLSDMYTWFKNVTLDSEDPLFQTSGQPIPITVSERLMENGKVILRVRIFKLHDHVRPDVNPPQVYTPEKSESAFILGMNFAMSWYGMYYPVVIAHIYHTHFMVGAQAYSLYNNINPTAANGKATHPVRMILDEQVEASRLHSFPSTYFLQGSSNFRSAISAQYNLAAMGAYKNEGPVGKNAGHLYNLYPDRQAEMSGFDVNDYTSAGGKDWDLWNQMSFSQSMFAVCRNYTGEVVSTYYSSDYDVKSDKGVQAWVASMQDPMGGNVGRINERDKVAQKNELADLLAITLFHASFHGILYNMDYFAKFKAPLQALPRAYSTRLPSPTAAYTEQDMLADWLPKTETLGRDLFLSFFFSRSSGAGPLILKGADGEPDWAARLPFPDNKKGRKANEATVNYRKDLMQFLYDFPVGELRDYNTQYLWPYNLPRVVDV